MIASQLGTAHTGNTLRHEKRLHLIGSVTQKPTHTLICTRTSRGTERLVLHPDTEVELQP